MPKSFVDSTGVCIGRWFILQRKKYKDGTSLPEQAAKLDKLGMIWEVKDN